MSIKQAVASAVEHLTDHPSEARYRDSVARAVLRHGLVVDVTGPTGESVTTDMPPSIGGTGSGPSPGWLSRASTASCVATLIALRAASLDVVLDGLAVIVDSESDDRGILGTDAATPPGPLSVKVVVQLRAGGADAAQLRDIATWGAEHCPVLDGLRRSVPVEVSIEA